MKSNFKKNLQTGFGISLLLLILSSVISFFTIRNLIDSSNLVDHTNEVILKSEEIISNIKDAETGQRGYLITKQPDFLEPYIGSYERTISNLSQLRQLTRDNLVQQRNCDSLLVLIDRRFGVLRYGIQMIDQGQELNLNTLRDGQVHMGKARRLVKEIQRIENHLLEERTSRMNKASGVAPFIILIAALIAILITVYFFRKVNMAYTDKALLTDELEKKDREIASRITTIDQIAGQIASGDYSVRLNAEQNDSLGSLSVSLNKMAAALNESFTSLHNKEWLQSGRIQLGLRVAGEKNLEQLSNDFLHFIVEYSRSNIGVLYVDDGAGNLQQTGAYGVSNVGGISKRFSHNEGIVGECFNSGKQILIEDVDEQLVTVFSGGTIKPRNLVFLPIMFENKAIAVAELGSLHAYDDRELEFFRIACLTGGIVFHMAENRKRVMELLEETQSQSEELQSQHRELESINAEMELQTEKLQTSEEELKVQQEELMETNQELEERSRMLEERNQLILLRNLEIQKKSEELAQSTRYKSEFLANMSHELRTPLNSILLLSRLLKENNEGNLSNEQTEYAAVIQNSGNGLLELIDEILDLSKIESGKLELEYEKINLSEVTNDMRMMFAPMAREKNIDFVLSTGSTVPALIETDKLRLEQIIKNLLSNALKFTSTGKIELKVDLADESDSLIEFQVIDTGIGIAADKQHLIFDAFQQADGSTKRKYGGTGLGLSISRQLAVLLGGEIKLESKPGEGSIFTLIIPVDREALAQEPVKETGNNPGPAQDAGGPVENSLIKEPMVSAVIPEELADDRSLIKAKDKVLLIVEDDLAFAGAVLDLVRQKGYKVVHVVRGDKVAEMAKQFHATGILMDVQLPVKDGITVMNELKADPATRHIPVHIMSSFQVKKESLSGGAVDFVQKPVAFEQMNSILEKIEQAIKSEAQKVLIVEDNTYHAKALSYFLSGHGVQSDITENIQQSVDALKKHEASCVILDMGIPGQQGYHTLETIKEDKNLENIPIIIFTGRSLSKTEEQRIRKYADAVIIKTAQSYQRILNEVSLFLHVMETDSKKTGYTGGLGRMDEVLNGKTVLIADDDVRNIFALNKVMEKFKMNVITATDGKDALNMLQQNPKTDIVLMDIMMPEMDGYEAIKKIRAKAEWRNLPVIAVTAKAMTGDRDKCIAAGASDYISKPVDTDQLISLMRVWLYDAS
jgi:signal transduction histidine kinase/DNA-binding response OmpR family regulator/CHASE3 domain sensor protein